MHGTSMLTCLVPLLVAQSGQILDQKLRSLVSEVPALLASSGYSFEQAKPDAAYGTLTRGGATVDASFSLIPRPRGERTLPARFGLNLRIEIPVGKDLALRDARQGRSSFLAPDEIDAMPHLGGTVTLKTQVPLDEPLDRDTVAEQVNRFWRFGSEFARIHRGAFVRAEMRDWTKARFSDDLILDYADGTSLSRAFASWGLIQPDASGKLPVGHPVGIRIGGTELGLMPHPIRQAEPHFVCSVLGDVEFPRPDEAGKWVRQNQPSIKWASMLASNSGRVLVVCSLDFTPGMRLGDIRQKIVSFAVNLKALQASVREH